MFEGSRTYTPTKKAKMRKTDNTGLGEEIELILLTFG